MKLLIRLTATLALLHALSGCGSDDSSLPSDEPVPPATVTVADRSISKSSLPSGCSLPEITGIFNEMLNGANSRNRAQVLRRIAPRPELLAFVVGRDSRSPTGNSGLALRTPSAIYRYFADQSRRGYRRYLLRASVQPIRPGDGRRSGPARRPASGPAAEDRVVAVGFQVTVRDKEGEDTDLSGKSAINCESGRFYMYGGG